MWNEPTLVAYLIPLEKCVEACCFGFVALVGSTAKHFHRRNVSSAAPDTTVVPSGDIAMCSTLAVWPVHKCNIHYIIVHKYEPRNQCATCPERGFLWLQGFNITGLFVNGVIIESWITVTVQVLTRLMDILSNFKMKCVEIEKVRLLT